MKKNKEKGKIEFYQWSSDFVVYNLATLDGIIKYQSIDLEMEDGVKIGGEVIKNELMYKKMDEIDSKIRKQFRKIEINKSMLSIMNFYIKQREEKDEHKY